jgi:hypothetical protein
MAKWKREQVGAVFKGLKNDDGVTGPDTLIFQEDVTFKKGDKLHLETKAYKEQNVTAMVQKGKMSEEVAEKAKYVISRMSEKVRADVVRLTKGE